MEKQLRFHWSLSQAGDNFRRSKSSEEQSGILSSEAQLALCQQAEKSGIDSMLMAVGSGRPDPMMLSVMLGQKTEKIKFLVAVRPGLFSPSFFVQQINTLSCLVNGRVHVNLVSGRSPQELRYYGDFLNHTQRYHRATEFLTICNAFWQGDGEVNFTGDFYQIEKGQIKTPFMSPDGRGPEIFVGGNSLEAANLASQHADCLWRFPDSPENIKPQIEVVLDSGKEVGLVVALITRPTQAEAEAAAQALIARFGDKSRKINQRFYQQSDSEGFQKVFAWSEEESPWITPYLWTGAVPYLGVPSIALVGSYENIAQAIMDYKSIGITQYLFLGWPDIEEMTHFSEGVVPLLAGK
ncbi:LLM class flavin-dependent oxidoreductase [Okeania sp. SIO2B3]|uniref:LLM class flavin-dependent oxidoreductase n=1 Tax=Okeania sp. SIO2B3 TaxID=2607784 RepID=UPI0013C1F16C|nr:LLM class flavin-dependent oxidoreductase [Okeania sp. SIO2B3]NET44476.1 LLM class flavin-dependent oxidoreductase [Okeania sp. SIO2B3]